MARSRFRLLVVTLVVALAVGCQQDEIRSYTVPKPEMNRLFGAILAHGDSTWFFKMIGPASTVAEHKEPFAEFLRSLRPPDAAGKPLTWTLPVGWQQDNEKRPGRFATILVGTEHPLELTVTRLGREGQASSVLANVNRWRNQLGLPPVTQEELAKDVTELKNGADTITLVNLVGAGSGRTGMGPPAAGERMPPAVVNPRSDLNYRVPEGWKKTADNQMSKATFQIADGDKKAVVTITPLGGGAGGLEENVNRWRKQVGLPPIGDAELRKLLKPITVAGKECSFADVAGASRRILGVIVARGDSTWFIKMDGAPELVEKQKSNFEAFAQSVRFDGGPGGNDG